MPSVSSKQRDYNVKENREEILGVLGNQNHISEAFSAPQFNHQIPDLVTLSLLPKSQWQSLANLDIIKARNKPIEPPKKPEKAPFFLPSVSSLSGEILFTSNGIANDDVKDTKAQESMRKLTKLDLSSAFCLLLQSCADSKDFSAFTEYIKGLSPSSLDLELRVLQIVDDDEESINQRAELPSIEILLDYFIHELSSKTNFEYIQAVIKLFLKIHGETIRRNSSLLEKALKLSEVQSLVWQKIDKMFQNSRCMVTFLSNSQF